MFSTHLFVESSKTPRYLLAPCSKHTTRVSDNASTISTGNIRPLYIRFTDCLVVAAILDSVISKGCPKRMRRKIKGMDMLPIYTIENTKKYTRNGCILFCTSRRRFHKLANVMAFSEGVPKGIAMCKKQRTLQKRMHPITIQAFVQFRITLVTRWTKKTPHCVIKSEACEENRTVHEKNYQTIVVDIKR